MGALFSQSASGSLRRTQREALECSGVVARGVSAHVAFRQHIQFE